MRLSCGCGRTFRARDHDCPGCGATLQPQLDDRPARPVPLGSAKIDPEVLVRQKLALRDELRLRDRQLRQAEARLRELRVVIERLRQAAAGSAPSRIVDAPLSIRGLPSDRPDLDLLPLSDERSYILQNAITLPDDRLPIFEEPA